MDDRILGYVPGGTGGIKPFDALFNKGMSLDEPDEDSVIQCDAVVIWGGGDISPSLYGEGKNSHTYAPPSPSRQDMLEWDVVQLAKKHKKPIIGVCRGAQLLCAAAGGRLWQHTDEHRESHYIQTVDGKRILTSSVHHQMMRPEGSVHEIIAFEPRQQIVFDATDTPHEIDVAPEIVFFKDINGLAIQGHPEFMNKSCEFVEYCLGLIKDRFLDETTNVS